MSEGIGYKIKRGINNFVTGLMSQKEREGGEGDVYLPEGIELLSRKVASEGAVLLKNENILPLKSNNTVSVFGRIQIDYFAVGYGSGGDVNEPYIINLLEALRANEEIQVNETLAGIYEKWCKENPVDHGYWGHWPRFHPEMPLTNEVVTDAANNSDAAVVVIGRAAGEDRENTLEKGSYYLTDDERDVLNKVTAAFDKVTVLIDSGNIMDLAWLEEYGDKIGAVLFVWQGGMESGNAIADILTGQRTPSGKLANAYARHYENYPSASNFGNKAFNNYAEDIYVGYRYFETFAKEDLLFPFGFGLSYTSFAIEVQKAEVKDEQIALEVKVTNTGDTYTGKEVVQVYYGAPQGNLGNPAKELVAFAKTDDLAPGASQTLTINFAIADMASFDDSGVTGYRYVFVLEEGDYAIYVGNNVANAQKVFTYTQTETKMQQQLSSVIELPEENIFKRMKPAFAGENMTLSWENVPTEENQLVNRILENLPQGVPLTGNKGYTLLDVKNGKISMEAFIGQLSLDELEAISRGDYRMGSPLGALGNAGVFGGVLPSLREKGVTPVTTTDGPSGIRLNAFSSLLPCGTLLACTWDTNLVEQLYQKIGDEMMHKGSDVLLAPGMNIHRDPLCGRNFEYFSEDPLLTGCMAGAMVRGLQSQGVAACPKHFTCNNQEENRTKNDSRVSQRALREIYLRAFEICIHESNPHVIMTSYNKVNGVWSHYNYDLCTRILRDEWQYEGLIITDWWMQYAKDPNFPKLRDNAYRVRAQVDVLMPGGKQVGRSKPDGTLLKSYKKQGGITLGEMQRVAANVLNCVMRSYTFKKENGLENEYKSPESIHFTVE